MNVALQINRSEINDKFGHHLSFHLHVSQSKEPFWRLAQTKLKQTRKKASASLWEGAFCEISGPKKIREPEEIGTGNGGNRK